jgi:hypothetical protein
MPLGRPNNAVSQIRMQVMWSRLIAVVEAQTLVRTAFSTTVREAGDPLGWGVRPQLQHPSPGGDQQTQPCRFDGRRGQKHFVDKFV